MRATRALVMLVLLTAILAMLVLFWCGLTPAAQADQPDPAVRAYEWACHWSDQVQKNRIHARNHARYLGVRLPAKLRAVVACPVQLEDAAEDVPYLYEWAKYGAAWKAQAKALARYTKKTWRRIGHPRHIVNARTWLPLLRHEKWPKSQIPTALKVIRRESGGQPWAIGGGSFYGLFQIYEGFNTGGWDLCDPVVNVRLALQLYRRSGWQPWSATAY